ncbi:MULTISPECIES: glycosyltransferase [unclassified Pseudoalteromonas]|uniref:glycosyltransferase n=1 Tax=unclassified Pseudoalteromonas TaxID=194690 RepID=UPI000B66D6C5|nr:MULTISPECIES: glycosyltransferase [unclassified Pseudoalteromonas]MAJ40101.1 glycosyltransferase [Pseudoalteromonadaceae bacterium]OUX88501.1 MAG: glycosyltransferase [Pseudoalteromonas sp. TMED43]MDC9564941.1 glycosyltransferase [Pseudoalteromonas sp. GAB2316C]MDC9569343.1 glycosyltransferase [Pseudoalteromonas sp. GABNB9D]MDC9575523.1 glycosyltransferase [Pseudoalteromonas sp. GABNS16A]|tara:strand:+ start:611 stop:1840 length:1230 start_codon:yes stop_codon:yes gene_type:complete
MKKVLVIGYVWPEPNSSAAGTHMMSLLNAFKAQNWQVEFATPAQRTEHMVNLDHFGITSQSIALNCESFDEYVKAYNPDIVMFDRFMMEEQFGWRVDKHCPNAFKILDTEDLQCLRNARHEAHKGEREFTTSDLHSDIAKREIAAILRCDLSLIISSFEMQLLSSVFNVEASLLHHLPFMVDLTALPAQTNSFEQREHFMTIGNFRHAPNWDAVLYLQKIWPLIRKQLPKAELHIYGSYPPPKATALNNPKTGFLIKGWADNAYEVMQSARVCLAPLRFGAGIKGKLLEAMIMQTPSVTTNIGSEGMHNELPWPGKVTNNTDDFANAAVELYTNQADFEHAQQAGNTLLNTLYDKVKLSAALINKIDSISNDLKAHREKNFTGQMLKHHTMRSTQYMAQWIAEKNKKLD